MKQCTVDGCGKPHRARGWCWAHYMRWHKMRRANDPTTPSCNVADCNLPSLAVRGMCRLHYQRWLSHGDPLIVLQAPKGAGTVTPKGYRVTMVDGLEQLDHVRIASRAFGGPLPKGAEVHHVDGDGLNNAPSNLVICPSHAYHMLLHQRTRALNACGNANWRKCHLCKRYDDPSNLVGRGKSTMVHSACRSESRRNRMNA